MSEHEEIIKVKERLDKILKGHSMITLKGNLWYFIALLTFLVVISGTGWKFPYTGFKLVYLQPVVLALTLWFVLKDPLKLKEEKRDEVVSKDTRLRIKKKMRFVKFLLIPLFVPLFWGRTDLVWSIGNIVIGVIYIINSSFNSKYFFHLGCFMTLAGVATFFVQLIASVNLSILLFLLLVLSMVAAGFLMNKINKEYRDKNEI